LTRFPFVSRDFDSEKDVSAFPFFYWYTAVPEHSIVEVTTKPDFREIFSSSKKVSFINISIFSPMKASKEFPTQPHTGKIVILVEGKH
jgi:hypothetical protein